MAAPTGGNSDGSEPSPLVPPKKKDSTMRQAIKLYLSGTGSSDAALIYTLPKPGRLIAVQYHIRATIAAAVTEYVTYELSTQSASQFSQNEAQGIIASFGAGATAATANLNVTSIQVLSGFDFTFDAGSKIYVHRLGPTPFAASLLYLNLNFI